MCDFRPGDEVVYVDDRLFLKPGFLPAEPLTLGAIYVVEKIYYREVISAVCICLVGYPNRSQGRDVGFRQSRFRKVQRRDLTAWLATENTIEGPTCLTPKRVPATQEAGNDGGFVETSTSDPVLDGRPSSRRPASLGSGRRP